MVTVENEENEENNKTIISSIVYSEEERIKIANTEDLHKILSKILKREDKINQEKEHFWFIGLNLANEILCIDTVSLGTVYSADVTPMNVFRNGVWRGCTHAILAHNHPSGSLKPSKEDIDVTDRLYQCGLILNIPIRDHMILNMTTFITFEDNGVMAKIEKSLKFKPHYKIVEDMKAEAEEIRQKALEEGRKEGLVAGKIIGFDKGKQEKAIEMAKKLLKRNVDIDIILETTGFTIEEINDIKKDMGLSHRDTDV